MAVLVNNKRILYQLAYCLGELPFPIQYAFYMKGKKEMEKTLTIHDAKKELPTESGNVVVFKCDENGIPYFVSVVHFSHEHRLFNAFDCEMKKEAKRTAIKIDFWAYPPNFEKEMQSRNEGQE